MIQRITQKKLTELQRCLSKNNVSVNRINWGPDYTFVVYDENGKNQFSIKSRSVFRMLDFSVMNWEKPEFVVTLSNGLICPVNEKDKEYELAKQLWFSARNKYDKHVR